MLLHRARTASAPWRLWIGCDGYLPCIEKELFTLHSHEYDAHDIHSCILLDMDGLLEERRGGV